LISKSSIPSPVITRLQYWHFSYLEGFQTIFVRFSSLVADDYTEVNMILNKFIFPMTLIALLLTGVGCRKHLDVKQANAALDERLDNMPDEETEASGYQVVTAKISVGESHACAILNNRLYCWGDDSSGQVGVRVDADYDLLGGDDTDSLTDNSSLPVEVFTTDDHVEDVALGTAHTCAVVDGALYCWGDNSEGQLGNSACVDDTLPCEIISSGVTKVVAAQNNTCAIVEGALQCWGDNSNDQVGDGTGTDATSPQVILASGVTDVSTSGSTTCAVVRGALFCWGLNDDGEFGNGTTDNSSTPLKVINSNVKKVSVSAINNMACAIIGTALKCWGDNSSYQLGNGTDTNSLVPVTVFSSGVTDLSISQNQCAVVNGALKCWGPSDIVDTNIDVTDDDNLPVTVTTSGVKQLSVGSNLGCYVNTSNSFRCWGYNSWEVATVNQFIGLHGLGAYTATFTEFPFGIIIFQND
jgi:hypothetical protein